MKYGVIYIKICPKEGTPGDWIKYCQILSATPKSFQLNAKVIADDINSRYSDDIVIPMDIDVNPGCTTTPESVKEIAEDMYNQFCELVERQGIPNSVRCVYSVGELRNVNVDSTHHLGNDKIMVKLGRFLDESDEPGIFEVDGTDRILESIEEMEEDSEDIMQELKDEGFKISFERDTSILGVKDTFFSVLIERPYFSPAREIPGLPSPPGGLYSGDIFAWKEVKGAVIRLNDWYYSHSGRDYTPGINGEISNKLTNMGIKVETKSPFRMFSGGTEFGIGWSSPEDFDSLGDTITFTRLTIAMML